MTWTLGPTRIFVQGFDDDIVQIIARLTPLASGTILQTFGWEDLVKSLQCVIVGGEDKVALIDMSRSGSPYTLSGLDFSWRDYYIKSIKFKTRPSARQTIRQDLDLDAAVYDVNLELYKDE